MFDLTAGTVDRPFRDSHASASLVSAAVHVAAIGSVAWVVMFSINNEALPEVPVMIAFVAEAPAPPPPPPPPPPAAAAKAARPSEPVPASGPAFTVPAAIPVGIQPEQGLDAFDGEGGVVGGVEGGIPGGVLGGIPGGVVGEVLPPPPPPRPAPARVGGDIKAPALIHRVEPEYPPMAVAAKVTGIVILEATVNEAGAVTDVRTLRSIILLDQAAINAVKQWRYQPLVLNGQPVPFILTVTLSFSLR
jgi:protein TonB